MEEKCPHCEFVSVEKHGIGIHIGIKHPETLPMESPSNPVGRPWFDGKEEDAVVSKLEEVWSIGATDREAALYADISLAALNRYMDVHDELRDRRDMLKEKPLLKARKTIVDSLGKPEHAKWYQERKNKKEFAQRTETTGPDGIPLPSNTIVLTDFKKSDEAIG